MVADKLHKTPSHVGTDASAHCIPYQNYPDPNHKISPSNPDSTLVYSERNFITESSGMLPHDHRISN